MTIKEFIKKSRLKTWDVIIIAILVLGSFLPLVVFARPCCRFRPLGNSMDSTQTW